MIDLTVRDHARDATHPPVVVVPNASLRHVAHHLWEHAVAAAVGADADDVLGVISERDVVTQLAQGVRPRPVGQCPPATEPDATVDLAG